MKKRNTIQKQIILDSIRNTKIHPTANELYKIIHMADNSISMATIYRNLKEMVENGNVKIITKQNGSKRYDGDISNHDHFVCSICGKVLDLNVDTKSDVSNIEQIYKFQIFNKNTIYEGKCENCLKK